ncbi:hypothetical protein N7481_013320 [Penicillium waksmanii]|uniref:uncharacterized protein n=1 Tax=Penicillium waksmanii TaxID=69791 RepID=UPI00254941D6|nr:uncharacterized protein N7481_013320 [Penicillium waksmanii]KAJ5966606.1 hypothetical protein N7481_013320 [Penicillium waksmanii]
MDNLYTCAEAGESLTGNLTDTVYQCLFDYCEKSDPDLLGCPDQAIITSFEFDAGLDPYPYFAANSGSCDHINKQANTDIGGPGDVSANSAEYISVEDQAKSDIETGQISENNGLLTMDYNGIEKFGF